MRIKDPFALPKKRHDLLIMDEDEDEDEGRKKLWLMGSREKDEDALKTLTPCPEHMKDGLFEGHSPGSTNMSIETQV